LGLIREDENLTNRFLGNHSSIESIRKEIEGRTTICQKVSTALDLPMSNECKRILAYAAEETERLIAHEMESELSKSGPVRDADTAKRIAEALWIPKYGADTVASQAPLQAELKFNVWIVTGSSSTGPPLYAFIFQPDGRILSSGQWLTKSPDPVD